MVETKRGSSLFGGIRSLFVEEVPDGASPAPAVPAAPAPTVARPMAPAPSFAPASPPPVAPDPSVIAKLEAKLKAKLPPVYAAFMDQYETLRDVIPDETTRFKAALKTSKTTPEQLSGAVDTLLQVMADASSEFSQTFEENKTKTLAQAKQGIDATETRITAIEAEISRLQAEVASLRTKVQTDRAEMQSEEQRLDGIRASFEAAHAQVVGSLTSQKNHIASQPKG